ncbi:MAG TPA: DEAD/DEAH box helicase [Gemmatimonadales bacterium]|nr:DEAD/DEAH box helicase [Gemmatimonadales bacterium]
MSNAFTDLGLADPLVQSLTALGYEEPTPIQREAIPPLLAGRDLLGQAATGTGKTAAFALPLLQRIPLAGADEDATPRPAVLVLVPTRELAMQVAEAMHKYGRTLGIRVLAVYGGQAFDQQLRALRRGVHVVVATPGRALDHIRRGTLGLDALQAVVLDEADEMLDMGFAEDLELILDATPAGRQTALFSATMPPRIAAIAERHLRDPEQVRIARETVPEGELPRVRQTAYVVPRAHKVAALGRVLDLEDPASAIVFCRTRGEVDELAETLASRGYRAEALHGGMSQEQRDRVMKRLRSGTADLLIATDVAARGLDVEHLTHVVNFDVPSSPAVYVHRIGRTGRAGREGVAITLAEPREHRLLRNIEQLTRQRIDVAAVPTVVEVRARRLDLTRGAVRDAILQGELDGYRVVVEALADEFDPMDIATAAVKLAHEATQGAQEDTAEIPAVAPAAARKRERGERGERAEGSERGRGPRPPRRERGQAGGEGAAPMTRIYVGAGRKANVRPGDLVGAITNEAGIDARAIGAIEIADGFSLVELPEDLVDPVIDALRQSTIKGRRMTVRRERFPARRGPARRAGGRPH